MENSVLALKAKEVERQISLNQQCIKETKNEEDILILLEEQKGLKIVSRQINSRLSRIIIK